MTTSSTHRESEVVVRTAAPGDAAAIAAVHLEAFANDDRPTRLVELVVASDRHVPHLSLVAEVDGAAVGHVLFSHVDLVGDDGVAREVVALTPLGVRVPWQRRGIGGALVREGLSRADAASEALVTVEGHPGYYPRFGFGLASALGIELRLPSWAPREAAMAIALRARTSAHTGRIAYPSTFDVVLED